MSATASEPISEVPAKATGGSRRKSESSKRRTPVKSESAPANRFFLGKASANGAPALEREFPTEREIMVEALKTGQHYFVVSEWGAIPDLSKECPLIRREAIHREGRVSGATTENAGPTRSS